MYICCAMLLPLRILYWSEGSINFLYCPPIDMLFGFRLISKGRWCGDLLELFFWRDYRFLVVLYLFFPATDAPPCISLFVYSYSKPSSELTLMRVVDPSVL